MPTISLRLDAEEIAYAWKAAKTEKRTRTGLFRALLEAHKTDPNILRRPLVEILEEGRSSRPAAQGIVSMAALRRAKGKRGAK